VSIQQQGYRIVLAAATDHAALKSQTLKLLGQAQVVQTAAN